MLSPRQLTPATAFLSAACLLIQTLLACSSSDGSGSGNPLGGASNQRGGATANSVDSRPGNAGSGSVGVGGGTTETTTGNASGSTATGGQGSTPPTEATGGRSTDGAAGQTANGPTGGGSFVTSSKPCTEANLTCRIARPSCPAMQVPELTDNGTCYTGDCISIGDCTCNVATDCPNNNQYTCIASTKRCSPYL